MEGSDINVGCTNMRGHFEIKKLVMLHHMKSIKVDKPQALMGSMMGY